MQKNVSKKVKNLLKTDVSVGRQSHPRNGEHAAPRFGVYPQYEEHTAPHFGVYRAEKSFFNHFLQNIGV